MPSADWSTKIVLTSTLQRAAKPTTNFAKVPQHVRKTSSPANCTLPSLTNPPSATTHITIIVVIINSAAIWEASPLFKPSRDLDRSPIVSCRYSKTPMTTTTTTAEVRDVRYRSQRSLKPCCSRFPVETKLRKMSSWDSRIEKEVKRVFQKKMKKLQHWNWLRKELRTRKRRKGKKILSTASNLSKRRWSSIASCWVKDLQEKEQLFSRNSMETQNIIIINVQSNNRLWPTWPRRRTFEWIKWVRNVNMVLDGE